MSRTVTIKLLLEGSQKGVGAAFSVASAAVTGLNQALEIGKKAAEAAAKVWELTAGKTLEFRTAHDAGRIAVTNMERSVLRLQVGLGGALLPAAQGVIAAVRPIVDGMTAWLAKNRELAASGVVNFLANMAQTLVNGVATGIVWVTRGFAALQVVLDYVRIGANAVLGALVDLVEKSLRGGAAMASAFGKEGLAASLTDAADTAANLSGAMAEVSSESRAHIDQVIASQEKLEAGVAAVQAKVGAVVEKARSAGIAAAKGEIQQKAVVLDEEAALAKARAEKLLEMKQRAIDAEAALEKSARDRQTAINEMVFQEQLAAFQKRQEDLKAKLAQQKETIANFASSAAQGTISMAEEFVNAAGVVGGVGKAVEGLGLKILKLVGMQLLVGGLTAAFKALFTAIGFGTLGPLGFLFGLNQGGLIRRFGAGGPVSGDNYDSVPALVRPGEFVMTKTAVRQAASGLVPDEVRALGAGGGGGGGLALTLAPQMIALPSGADAEKFLNSTVLPWVLRQQAAGRLK